METAPPETAPPETAPPEVARPTRRQRFVQQYRAHAERLKPKQFRAPSLDALNFLVADVRGALGPYVTVFLASEQDWGLQNIGLVNMVGGYLGLAAQTPIGWILDHTGRKRELLMAALAVLGAGAAVIAYFPGFWPVMLANACMQVVSGVFDPAVAALTVGLFARQALTARMGRNAAFARAGNLTVAALSAAMAWMWSSRAVFLQVPIIALLAIVAAYSIPHGSIDLRRARGLRSEGESLGGPSTWKAVVTCRPLLVFGLCSLLYGFADAPLLTIVGQELGMKYKGWGIVLTSGLIVAAQAGMLVTALVVGRKADAWGHRWLLVVAFALLPLQAVLTVFWSHPAWLIAVQFLGNLGTGLLVALTPLLLADLMHGTGRYNFAQGAVLTLRSAGVATSGLASELVVSRFGYNATYLGCGLVGMATLALVWWAMPETSQMARPDQPASGRDPDPRGPARPSEKPGPEPDLTAPGFAPG